MRIYILLLIIITLLPSCNYDEFTLNKNIRGEEFKCFILTDYRTCEQLNDNSVMIYDGGLIALRRYDRTDLVSDVTVEIKEGEGAKFAMRCASNNNENHPAVWFTYSTNGIAVQEKGKSIINLGSYKAKINEPARIVFSNECKRYDIMVDCDTVYTGWTDIPNTEYLLIKSLPKSKVLLTGISMVEKGENDESNFIR